MFIMHDWKANEHDYDYEVDVDEYDYDYDDGDDSDENNISALDTANDDAPVPFDPATISQQIQSIMHFS